MDDLLLAFVIVGVGNHLKSSCSLGTDVEQREHPLHAVEPFLVEGVLVGVQVFNVGIPGFVGDFVPPGPPGDEGIETGDEFRSVPDGLEGLLNFGMCSNEPGSFGVAPSIGDKKADGSTSGPVLVSPGSRVISFDATP